MLDRVRFDPTPGHSQHRCLTPVPTHGGLYFIHWTLERVQRMIEEGGLKSENLAASHPTFPGFRRRLFLLAAQEALQPGGARIVRRLASALRPDAGTP